MLLLIMTIIFSKQEEVLNDDPLYSLGLYKVDNLNHESNQISVNERFPIYNYPTLSNFVFDDHLDNLYILNNRNRYRVMGPLSDFPCLFLEFVDLDLKNKLHIKYFVEKYGFLTTASKYKKISLLSSLRKSSINPNQFQENLNEGSSASNMYGESFEIWIRFQMILRTIIQVWRFLKNLKIKRKSLTSLDHKTLYESGLFNNEDNKLIFSNKDNKTIGDRFKLNSLSFFEDDKYLDKKYFENINYDIFNCKIDLTSDQQRHNPDFHQSFIMSNNFLEYFAEEFLREQLNEALNIFSPKIRLNGFVSFKSEITQTNMSKNLSCENLAQTIINQLIDVIVNDDQFIRCYECQKWMTIGRKKIEPKKYCSKQCRSVAYERRKRIYQSHEIKKIISENRVTPKIDEDINFENLCSELSKNIKNKGLFESMLKNIMYNQTCNSLETSVSDHLGLDYLESKGFFDYLRARTFKSLPFNFNPYWDWDFEQNSRSNAITNQ